MIGFEDYLETYLWKGAGIMADPQKIDSQSKAQAAEVKQNILNLVIEHLKGQPPARMVVGVIICGLMFYGAHHIPQDKLDDIIGGAFLIMSVLGRSNKPAGQTPVPETKIQNVEPG